MTTHNPLYNECVNLLSDESRQILLNHMRRRYQRDDFDLLEWVDDDDVANCVDMAFFESDSYPNLLSWGQTTEIAAKRLLEVYLDGDDYTQATNDSLVQTLKNGEADRETLWQD